MKINELFENEDLSKYFIKGSPLSDSKFHFIAERNAISSLIGCEDLKIETFYLERNSKLTSLRGLPKKIGDSVIACNCDIRSLEGIGKDYLCEMNGIINLEENYNLKSHILGLCKVKGLEKVYLDDNKLCEIMNKYIPLGDIVECSEELIENGYKEFAKL